MSVQCQLRDCQKKAVPVVCTSSSLCLETYTHRLICFAVAVWERQVGSLSLMEQACLDGMRERHCHLPQADIGQQIAQCVYCRKGHNCFELQGHLTPQGMGLNQIAVWHSRGRS